RVEQSQGRRFSPCPSAPISPQQLDRAIRPWPTKRASRLFLASIGDEKCPIDRQGPDTHSRGRKEGIQESWRGNRGSCFTDAAWRLPALDDMHLERRRLIHSHHPVVVEVALCDRAAHIRELAVESSRPTEHQAALYLRLDRVWIDHNPAVHGGHRSTQSDLTLRGDLHLEH